MLIDWIYQHLAWLIGFFITGIGSVFAFGKFVSKVDSRGKSNSYRLENLEKGMETIKEEVNVIENKQINLNSKLDNILDNQKQMFKRQDDIFNVFMQMTNKDKPSN